jgi:hypothetical protein
VLIVGDASEQCSLETAGNRVEFVAGIGTVAVVAADSAATAGASGGDLNDVRMSGSAILSALRPDAAAGGASLKWTTTFSSIHRYIAD